MTTPIRADPRNGAHRATATPSSGPPSAATGPIAIRVASTSMAGSSRNQATCALTGSPTGVQMAAVTSMKTATTTPAVAGTRQARHSASVRCCRPTGVVAGEVAGAQQRRGQPVRDDEAEDAEEEGDEQRADHRVGADLLLPEHARPSGSA